MKWLFKKFPFSADAPSRPVSFAKLLELPLHCMFISSFWATLLLMLSVVFAALRPMLDSNKNVAQICFLSNIISIV